MKKQLFGLSFQIILTHAYSKVVLRVLAAAIQAKKRFSVYVTESQPDRAGQVKQKHFPLLLENVEMFSFSW